MKLEDKAIINIISKSGDAFFLLVSSIILVRQLNKTEYGSYLIIMLIINTVVMLTYLGLPHSIYYFYQQTRYKRHFIRQCVWLSLLFNSSAAIIIFIGKGYLAKLLNNPSVIDFAWQVSLIIIFRSTLSILEPFLIVKKYLLLNPLISILSSLCIHIPIIIGSLFRPQLSVLINIMFISSMILFVCHYVLILIVIYSENPKKDLHQDFKYYKVRIIDQLKYSLPIGLSSYIGVMGQQLDQYIVSSFFMPKELAVYSRGAMRIPVLSNIQYTVNEIMMPNYLSEYQGGNIRGFLWYFHKSIEKVAKIKFPVFAFLFSIAPSLFILMYTKEYIEGANIFRVYLFLLLIGFTTFGVVPNISGNTSFILYSTIFAIIINVTLSIFLVINIGPIGAAIASVVSSIIPSIYLLKMSAKILNVSFNEILPWQYLIKLLVISITSSIPMYLLEGLVDISGLKWLGLLFFEVVIYSYIWLLLGIKVNIIDDDDFALIDRWFKFSMSSFIKKIT